ncbi:unnamed protein product [Musa textilis]
MFVFLLWMNFAKEIEFMLIRSGANLRSHWKCILTILVKSYIGDRKTIEFVYLLKWVYYLTFELKQSWLCGSKSINNRLMGLYPIGLGHNKWYQNRPSIVFDERSK